MIRVFNRHFLADFLKSFLLCVAVLTFVMYIGSIVKAIDFLSRGASGMLIMKVFTLNIPFTLSFVIPMSVLTAALLQFGRMSADGEITAMKASGVSLLQIAAPFLVVGFLLSLLCLYLNAEVAPRSHFARRQMLSELSKENPLTLIEEATFVDNFPGVRIYVGRKDGNHLEDIIILQFDGPRKRAEVTAKTGDVDFNPDSGTMVIHLHDVRLDEFDKDDPSDLNKRRTLAAQSYPLTFDVARLIKKGKINKKPSDMPLPELLRSIRDVRTAFPTLAEDAVARMRTKMAVEATTNLSLALSCFSFILIALPLGMRPARKETSNGIWLALVLFLLYYLFVIIADSLSKFPQYRPELIPMIPVVALQIIGAHLLWRNR
ncbi:MAG: LptF/LptG family permease [Kiritimatiellae bacterium]|nr:LptF/LptG family permease [Kiritimatiellia bacterium]